MSKAIEQVHDLIRPRMCGVCGSDTGVKVFRIASSQEGNGHVVAWCPTCARQIAYRLNRSFQEDMPEWVYAMQNIGKGGEKDELS